MHTCADAKEEKVRASAHTDSHEAIAKLGGGRISVTVSASVVVVIGEVDDDEAASKDEARNTSLRHFHAEKDKYKSVLSKVPATVLVP